MNGGGAFILVYLMASLILALPIFFAESIIGRRSRCDTFGAMKKLAPGTAWQWAGMLTIVSPLLILSYYSVVGGWSVEYLFKSLSFSFTEVPAEEIPKFFGRFISSPWQPIFAHTAFMAAVAAIVLAGVSNGIELFSQKLGRNLKYSENAGRVLRRERRHRAHRVNTIHGHRFQVCLNAGASAGIAPRDR